MKGNLPLWLTGLLLLGAAQLACPLGGKPKKSSLKTCVDDWLLGVRWKASSALLRHMKPDKAEHLRRSYLEEETLKVTDAEALEVEIKGKGKEASVRLRLKWHKLDDLTERTTVLVQTWKFEEKRWWLSAVEAEKKRKPDARSEDPLHLRYLPPEKTPWDL